MKKDMKKEAKKHMLKALKQLMHDDMHSPMKDSMKDKMQKVTVMSDSPEGLEEGLSKAQQIMDKRKSMSEDDEDEYSKKSKKDKYAEGGIGNPFESPLASMGKKKKKKEDSEEDDEEKDEVVDEATQKTMFGNPLAGINAADGGTKKMSEAKKTKMTREAGEQGNISKNDYKSPEQQSLKDFLKKKKGDKYADGGIKPMESSKKMGDKRDGYYNGKDMDKYSKRRKRTEDLKAGKFKGEDNR